MEKIGLIALAVLSFVSCGNDIKKSNEEAPMQGKDPVVTALQVEVRAESPRSWNDYRTLGLMGLETEAKEIGDHALAMDFDKDRYVQVFGDHVFNTEARTFKKPDFGTNGEKIRLGY